MDLKIKNIYFSIFSVIILGMVTLLDVKAQAPVGDKAGAKAFVQGFYDWYRPLYDDAKISYITTIEKNPGYFDVKLSDAIKRDYTEQPENAGEILGLDFDPFLGAQDTGVDYQPGNVIEEGNKFLVNIHCASIGTSKKEILATKVHVVAEVAKLNGKWKLTNVIYPDPPYPTNLLTVLANMRKERNQWLIKHHQKPHTN